MSSIMEIENLTLELGGRTIINIETFSLQAGENVSFMGPNGAGKSSLLLVMSGLLEPSSGKIAFHGRDIREYQATMLRRRMAMVFQKPLMFDLTVKENVELGLKFRQIPRKVREARAKPWLEKMGLTHLEKRQARTLSGGEAQRVALAQALVLEPEILFLDEPFANLDKEIREELMEQTGRLLKDERMATVLVTHYRKEAQALSDTVYFIEDGRLVGQEPVRAPKSG